MSSTPSKEQIELLTKLAEAAHNRFQQRREYEWKICFGIWTALGASAGLILNSTTWKPSTFDCWGATIVAFVLWVTFFFYFTLWIHGAHDFDKRVRDAWLKRLAYLALPEDATIFADLPNGVDTKWSFPACIVTAFVYFPKWFYNWIRTKRGKEQVPIDPTALAWCNPVGQGQLLVTLLFAVLFAGAVWSKFESQKHSESNHQNPNGVTELVVRLGSGGSVAMKTVESESNPAVKMPTIHDKPLPNAPLVPQKE